MTTCPLWLPGIRGLCACMDAVELACSLHHGTCLLRIRNISDIDAATIIVLAIKAAKHILVIPCEIGCTDESGMGKAVLHIIAISHSALSLRVDLPERLSLPAVNRTKVELPYHHGKAGLAHHAVEKAMLGRERIVVEAEHIKHLAADAKKSLVDIIHAGKAIAQAKVMRVKLELSLLDRLDIAAEAVIDECPTLLLVVAMVTEPLAQSSLDAAVLALEYHLAHPLLLPYPRWFIAHEVSDEPRIVPVRDDCLLEGFAQTFLEIISIHVTQSHEPAVGSRRIECAGDGLASLLLKFLV